MQLDKIEQDKVFKILKNSPQFQRKRHGSLWDRGSADSYYGRPRSPHWWPEGTGSGEKIENLTPAEREEYYAGYDHNEQFGDKKEW
jgi:hypothetical protein